MGSPRNNEKAPRWTTAENKLLIKLYNDNVRVEDMASQFPGRTEVAIRQHLAQCAGKWHLPKRSRPRK